MSILGTRVLRVEDPKFLTVGGTYTADLALDGVAHVTYVRSSVAHARITSIDTSAAELPSFETVPMETPTPLNALGAKGIGESGSIGSTPAVQNAVVDALSHLGVRHIDMPTTPQRVWAAIREAHQ